LFKKDNLMGLQKYIYYASSIARLLTQFDDPALILRIFLGRGGPDQKEVRLRDTGLRFKVRNAMDVWCLKETFVDHFYERCGTPLSDGWTVVDIGAGLGDFSILAAHGHPASRIYAYEPFCSSFDLLRKNLLLNQVANVQAYSQAIGGHTGQMQLDLSIPEPLQMRSAQAGGSSTAPRNPALVESLCLGDALEQSAITTCDLLKLDCEGAEYEILFQASEDALRRVRRIIMEYHDGVTPYSHVHMETFLREHGFVVTTIPNYVHSNLGYLYATT
jgi:FkbM family methyltransferase